MLSLRSLRMHLRVRFDKSSNCPTIYTLYLI
nr:MAG TPA: hypothetical protein [Caudoviricetes sp.]